MTLSTSSLHYRSLPLAAACRRVSALGFQAIDIWSHFAWAGPLCEHLEDALLNMGPEKFAPLLEECQLKLRAVSCYSAPFNRFAEPLGKLGGSVVIRGSGQMPSGATTRDLARHMKRFFESLKPDLELAEKHRCVLAVENHSGHSLLNRLDSLKVFVDLNQHPRLGIALAPYHIQKNGEVVEDAIRIASSQLKFFYAWQHAESTRQLPGIGPTDMLPWLRALANINYQGVVNPFMHHEPQPDAMDTALAKSRAYLLETYRKLPP
jgi:sugar phosphate isomerase/epimerase